MKSSLKEWDQQHSQNLNGKMGSVKNRISDLDLKGELSVLEDVEIAELHDLSINWHSLARVQNNISWQKLRFNWLQEGDAKSKKFHGVMSNRRRHNAINMVSVNDVNVEGVQNIRQAIFDHFSTHFKALGEARPGMEGLNFRKISYGEAGNLTKPFFVRRSDAGSVGL